MWALVSVLLTTGYVFYGQEVFTRQNDSQMISPVLLLAFATIRSFLCPAILIMLVSFAHKYVNRPIAFKSEFSCEFFQYLLSPLYFSRISSGCVDDLDGWAGFGQDRDCASHNAPGKLWNKPFDKPLPTRIRGCSGSVIRICGHSYAMILE